MKKIIAILLVVILSVVCTVFLASCGGDEVCEHTNIGQDGKCKECGEQINAPQPPAADGEIALVTNGAPNFQFVVGDSVSSIMKDVDELISDINDVLTTDVIRVSDSKSTEAEIEIILGSVKNRGDAYRVDEHYLGYKGYEVKLVGKKIVVYAGDVEQYEKAFNWLKKDVFGISKSTESIDSLVITADDVNKQIMTEYDVDSVKIAGNDLDDYVIAFDKKYGDQKQLAENAQTAFYRNFGAWCELVSVSSIEDDDKVIVFEIIENTGSGDGFRAYVSDAGDLVLECQFPDRFTVGASEVLINKIASTRKNLSIPIGDYYSHNLRDIYYSEFGAKGDGFTDDFYALKACHEYANTWGHTVHSDGANKTYYIGSENGYDSIVVMTDTYWHGAGFIFDDTEVVPGDAEWDTPIFKVDSKGSAKYYDKTDTPVQSLSKEATELGWAPGYDAIIVLFNENVVHYRRYGFTDSTANGNSMREIIVVDENGVIDPSTPLQWDFTTVTQMYVYDISTDAPIVISGSDQDYVPDESLTNDSSHSSGGHSTQAHIKTLFFNLSESSNNYSGRVIKIERANVTIKNIYHSVEGEYGKIYGAPYDGFINVSYSSNVTVEGCTFRRYHLFDLIPEPNDDGTDYEIRVNTSADISRSYEITATYSNDVTWKNCDMVNFFNESDGAVRTNGMMGTNYCKNLTLDNCQFNTFDAHCGVYNATVKNTTLAYLSIIGDGTLTVENTVFYTTRHSDITHAIWLRDDYGSTFWGDIVVRNVELKYADRRDTTGDEVIMLDKTPTVWLIDANGWRSNHDYGYDLHLGRNITVDNVWMTKIDYGIDANGERWETNLGKNLDTLWLFTKSVSEYNGNQSDEAFVSSFYGPLTVDITNCGDLTFELPRTCSGMFDDTVFTIDGKVATRKLN